MNLVGISSTEQTTYNNPGGNQIAEFSNPRDPPKAYEDELRSQSV